MPMYRSWSSWSAAPAFLALLLTSPALPARTQAAESIQWRTDLGQAVSEAASRNRPLLIKVSTSWCGFCKKMARETYQDSTVVEHVTSCFVPVQIDGDAQRDLVKSLGVKSFPTAVIISPELQIVAKIKGFRTASQLTHELAGVCNHDEPPEAAGEPQEAVAGKASVFGELCPVSPLALGSLAPGDPQIRLDYRGYDLTFASREFREAFQQQPSRYWPAADGYCVVSRLEENAWRPGSAQLGLLHQGRIWFFASEENRRRFRQRPEFYVRQLKALARRDAVASNSAASTRGGTY